MPRPQRITDEQIARAARATFLEHGPSVPVSAIARALGVSHAAILQRVGSKEQLMLRSLGPEPAAVTAVAEALAEGPSPDRPIEVQLSESLIVLLEFLRQLVPSLVVLRAAGHSFEGGEREPPPVMLRRRLAAWLARARRQGASRVHAPAMMAEALLGALEARCFNAYVGGETYVSGVDDRRFVRTLVRALVGEPRKRSGEDRA